MNKNPICKTRLGFQTATYKWVHCILTATSTWYRNKGLVTPPQEWQLSSVNQTFITTIERSFISLSFSFFCMHFSKCKKMALIFWSCGGSDWFFFLLHPSLHFYGVFGIQSHQPHRTSPPSSAGSYVASEGLPTLRNPLTSRLDDGTRPFPMDLWELVADASVDTGRISKPTSRPGMSNCGQPLCDFWHLRGLLLSNQQLKIKVASS